MKKVTAIIQARMGSSRLPGKTLENIEGESLLCRVILRVKACELIDETIVATTTGPEDNVIEIESNKAGAAVYRGSRDDVLDRYYKAALKYKADVIVRITADDPFKDAKVIGDVINAFNSGDGYDYASNTLDPTYPEGIDVEVFSFDALQTAWEKADKSSEREHVTPYIWKNRERFKVFSLKYAKNLSHFRWTIDYPEDLAFAREVYRRFGENGLFSMEELLNLLENEPSLNKINSGFERNAGYKISVQDENRGNKEA